MENYKLFTGKEIVFDGLLSVFDGPNGYGKTSVFDAIEFLITGTISRVKESDSISGTIGYFSNFLAKNSKKDVIIKGEFTSGITSTFVIGLRVPVNTKAASKKNNPKNIDTQTETFLLPAYDTPIENWSEYYVDNDAAQVKRIAFFGSQNLNFFTMIHYIHQEDRLAYFKQSESERTNAIEQLFGVELEHLKASRIEQAHKQLIKRLNTLSQTITTLGKDIQDIPADTDNKVEYVSLAGGKSLWDCQNFSFHGIDSSQLFEQAKTQLEGIRALFHHQEPFFVIRDFKQFEKIEEPLRPLAILAWVFSEKNPNEIQTLENECSQYNFMQSQNTLVGQLAYANLDYAQLCSTLNCAELKDSFVNLVDQIKTASANQSDLQKSISSLIKYREQLHQHIQHFSQLEDGACPYCGKKWEDHETLEKQFKQTQQTIEGALGRENDTYTQLVERLKTLYVEKIQNLMNEKLHNLENDIGFQIFQRFQTKQKFQQYAKACVPVLQRLKISSSEVKIGETLQESIDRAQILVERIYELSNSISAEYNTIASKFDFEALYHTYFEGTKYLSQLDDEKLDQKYRYIENQYYHSFDASRAKLKMLQEQKDKLEPLCTQMKYYSTALNDALKSYQQLVIEQIEIPFFLYSSRLLQSYQGGQGVLIQTDGKSVRFTAPGSEHDVLYTMSSGQLSAVLLAFSLALNKIYAGNEFQTLLIDDPIQCMDDINMISFVELLRREFGISQIVLSTHEDSFSDYIRYKFTKYSLLGQTITLRES